MLFEKLLNFFGYYKKIKTPSFHDYVKTQKEYIDYTRELIKPVIKACIEEFINDGIVMKELMRQIYTYYDHKVKFNYHFSSFSKPNTQYSYELDRWSLTFYFNKKIKLSDYDYTTIVFEELDKVIAPYGLKRDHDWYITAINEEDINLANYCVQTLGD